MSWITLGKFLVTYRKHILGGLAVLAAVLLLWWAISSVLNHYYEKGKAEADLIWTTKYNKDIEAKNTRIKELEQQSKTSAARLAAAKDTAQLMVDDLYKKWQEEKKKNKPTSKVRITLPSLTLNGEHRDEKIGNAAPNFKSETNEPLNLLLDTSDVVLPPDYIKAWNDINSSSGATP